VLFITPRFAGLGPELGRRYPVGWWNEQILNRAVLFITPRCHPERSRKTRGWALTCLSAGRARAAIFSWKETCGFLSWALLPFIRSRSSEILSLSKGSASRLFIGERTHCAVYSFPLVPPTILHQFPRSSAIPAPEFFGTR